MTRSHEKGASFESILIAIPPARIAEFKAIIESYDNLATLRTEDPRRHHLRLYFASDQKDTVNQLIESLRERFEIRRLV
ncbi:MAG TPA: DUF4911 domain-containing protein [Candidatus Binataceae bacterium]|nr:DUF4911 domain-containing protein [Candidatus Binataceae bacterium]